jgi:rhodanese-related sulfurtransferase
MSTYREISPKEVFAARSTARLIDVREPAELVGELGRIPGAESVPLGTLPAAARGWDRTADIVVVCRSGGRSTAAAKMLVQAGFERVANLTGGMLAYAAAALPITR